MVIIQKTAYAPAAESKSTRIANHAATVALARSVAPASLIILDKLLHLSNIRRLPGALRTGKGARAAPEAIFTTIDPESACGLIRMYTAGSGPSP